MQKYLYQIFILILLIITSCSTEKKNNVISKDENTYPNDLLNVINLIFEDLTAKKQRKVSAEVGKILSSDRVTYSEAIDTAKSEGVDLPKIINERDSIQMNIANSDFNLNIKNTKDWKEYRNNTENAETFNKIKKIANQNEDYKYKSRYINKMYTLVKGPGSHVTKDTTEGAFNMYPIETNSKN